MSIPARLNLKPDYFRGFRGQPGLGGVAYIIRQSFTRTSRTSVRYVLGSEQLTLCRGRPALDMTFSKY